MEEEQQEEEEGRGVEPLSAEQQDQEPAAAAEEELAAAVAGTEAEAGTKRGTPAPAGSRTESLQQEHRRSGRARAPVGSSPFSTGYAVGDRVKARGCAPRLRPLLPLAVPVRATPLADPVRTAPQRSRGPAQDLEAHGPVHLVRRKRDRRARRQVRRALRRPAGQTWHGVLEPLSNRGGAHARHRRGWPPPAGGNARRAAPGAHLCHLSGASCEADAGGGARACEQAAQACRAGVRGRRSRQGLLGRRPHVLLRSRPVVSWYERASPLR